MTSLAETLEGVKLIAGIESAFQSEAVYIESKLTSKFLGRASDVRLKLTAFEEEVNQSWDKLYKKHEVDHVFKIPQAEYDKNCFELKTKQLDLIRFFIKQAAEWQDQHCLDPVAENPYVRVVGLLCNKYAFWKREKP